MVDPFIQDQDKRRWRIKRRKKMAPINSCPERPVENGDKSKIRPTKRNTSSKIMYTLLGANGDFVSVCEKFLLSNKAIILNMNKHPSGVRC